MTAYTFERSTSATNSETKTINTYTSVDELRAIEHPSYVCYSNIFAASIWAVSGERPRFAKIEPEGEKERASYVSVFYKPETYYAAVKIIAKEQLVEPMDFNDKWIQLGNTLRELPDYEAIKRSYNQTSVEECREAAEKRHEVIHNLYRASYIYAATDVRPTAVIDDRGVGFDFDLPQEMIRMLVNEFDHGVSNFSGRKFVEKLTQLRTIAFSMKEYCECKDIAEAKTKEKYNNN